MKRDDAASDVGAVKLMPAYLLVLVLFHLGFMAGKERSDKDLRRELVRSKNDLKVMEREKDIRIRQLERAVAVLEREEREPARRSTVIRDLRDIPASGFKATCREQPWGERRWEIDPSRYPPVSGMNRIGGGR